MRPRLGASPSQCGSISRGRLLHRLSCHLRCSRQKPQTYQRIGEYGIDIRDGHNRAPVRRERADRGAATRNVEYARRPTVCGLVFYIPPSTVSAKTDPKDRQRRWRRWRWRRLNAPAAGLRDHADMIVKAFHVERGHDRRCVEWRPSDAEQLGPRKLPGKAHRVGGKERIVRRRIGPQLALCRRVIEPDSHAVRRRLPVLRLMMARRSS